MPAFAAIRVYLYASLAAAIIGAAAWYTYHERSIGANKEVAVVEKASAKQEVIEQKASATAAATETQASTIYDETNRSPPPAQLPIECVRHDPSRVQVQHTNTSGAAAPASEPAAVSGDGPEYNPSGVALERAKQADAQIAYLQARVKELEKLIADANAK